MSPPPRSRSAHVVAAALLMISLAGGVALRIQALSEPVWLDELHTAWCVSESFADVMPRATQGNQSPLFFWMQYPVFQGMGRNELALRILPLLFSTGLLVSIGWIAWQLSGSLTGAWLALTLAAIDDAFLFYAVEARPYGLVQLVTVWQVYLWIQLLQAKERSGWSSAGFVALTVLLFYLHFTTVLLLAVQLAVTLLAVSRRFRQLSPAAKRTSASSVEPRPLPGLGEAKNWVLVWSVILGGCLPGLISLFRIAEYRDAWKSMVVPNQYGLMLLAQAIVYLGAGLLAVLCFRRVRLENRQRWLTVCALLVLVLFPTIGAYAATVFQLAPLSSYRFTIASTTLLIVLAGVFCGLIDSQRRRIIVAGVTVLLAVATNPLFEPWLRSGAMPAQRNENWRDAAVTMRNDFVPVVLCPNLVEDRRLAITGDPTLLEYFRFPLNGDSWSSDHGGRIQASHGSRYHSTGRRLLAGGASSPRRCRGPL